MKFAWIELRIVRFTIHPTACLLALGIVGCSALLDGMMDPYPSYEEQQQFLSELNAQGLPQRERCIRMRAFHEGWAKDQSECASFLDSLDQLEEAADKGEVEVKKVDPEITKDNVQIKKP